MEAPLNLRYLSATRPYVQMVDSLADMQRTEHNASGREMASLRDKHAEANKSASLATNDKEEVAAGWDALFEQAHPTMRRGDILNRHLRPGWNTSDAAHTIPVSHV